MATYGLIIGRFQPLHNGHINLIRHALSRCDRLIIVLGSFNCSPNIRNPFNSVERRGMILMEFVEDKDRIAFCDIPDFLNDDARWLKQLMSHVNNTCVYHFNEITNSYKENITIFCHEKDAKYYRTNLPYAVELVPGSQTHLISASDIRQIYFNRNRPDYINGIPQSTITALNTFMKTSLYTKLCDEMLHVTQYNRNWEKAPFRVPLTTVDAVLIHKGSVLVITRKNHPGKGTYALPGGFVDQYEPLQTALFRELIEETGVDLDFLLELYQIKQHQAVFDSPLRSLRGRIITHVFGYYFPDDAKPEYLEPGANDDAEMARWMHLDEFVAAQPKFYADHHEIIEHFFKQNYATL